MSDTPRPDDSRAIHIARFKKTVDKVAPSIDQTRVLSPEEVEKLRAETVQRQEDRRCAKRDGRSGSLKRLHAAVERVTGTTPPNGEPLPSRSVRPIDPLADVLDGTDEPGDDEPDEGESS